MQAKRAIFAKKDRLIYLHTISITPLCAPSPSTLSRHIPDTYPTHTRYIRISHEYSTNIPRMPHEYPSKKTAMRDATLSTPDSPFVSLLAVLCTAVVRRVAVVCFAFASGLANVSFTQFSLPLLCFRKRLRSKKCTFLLFSLARMKKK